MTKTVLILSVSAALAGLMPLTAQAQAQTQAQTQAAGPAVVPSAPSGVAASLPNAFDEPDGATPHAPPSAPQAAPQRSGPSTSTPSDPAVVASAEAALRETIAAFQSGTPNFAAMSPDVATKVRAQAGVILPMVQGFGALQSVSHVGSENGAELFLVLFKDQATQWIIAQGDDHKITVLLFRPASDAPTDVAAN